MKLYSIHGGKSLLSECRYQGYLEDPTKVNRLYEIVKDSKYILRRFYLCPGEDLDFNDPPEVIEIS